MSKESKAKPREFWILDEQLQFGPSISSDPKDHATLVALFRIPIKSNAVHLVEYSALDQERAKSARLLEALTVASGFTSVRDYQGNMSKIINEAIADYNQSEGGDER
jgi:hypothetical protein